MGDIMKYTRYNIKPKRKSSNNPLFYLAIVLLLALLFATIIVTVLKKSGNPMLQDFFNISLPGGEDVSDKKGGESTEAENQGKDQASKGENNGEEGETTTSSSGGYVLLQCGAFKVKENAEKILGDLKVAGNPFIIQDGELYKVYSGIYTKDKAEEAFNSLKSSGVESSRVTIAIDAKDPAGVQLSKCVESLLQVINKFSDNAVVSVETKDLKDWVAKLENLEVSSEVQKDVSSIKDYINNLPEKVDKNQISDMLATVGKIIIKYKK